MTLSQLNKAEEIRENIRRINDIKKAAEKNDFAIEGGERHIALRLFNGPPIFKELAEHIVEWCDARIESLEAEFNAL